MTPWKLSAAELRGMWQGTRGIRFTDANYLVPDRDWLLETARTHAGTRPPWVPAFDCDDFAFSLKLTAQALHARKTPLVDGLAVGVLFYAPDNGRSNHAINWSVSEEGLWFLEPQTGHAVSLSESELQSVFFVYC